MATVKELIEKLAEFPPDLPIVCGDWRRHDLDLAFIKIVSLVEVSDDSQYGERYYMREDAYQGLTLSNRQGELHLIRSFKAVDT